jgi:hypothetical protein
VKRGRPDEEGTLQSDFLLRLPFEIPDLRLFRRNVGAAKMPSGRVVRFAIKGQCDTYGICDGGRHVEVELKALHGRLSPEQRAWRAWCLAHSVPYLLCLERAGEDHAQTVARWVAELRQLVGQG